MTDAPAIDEELARKLERSGIARGTYSVEPLSRIHKFIAQRLTEAAQGVPSFPVEMDVALDALLARRATHNAAGAARVSVNDLIVKASAVALKAVPAVNASFTPEGIIRHQRADIGVAVATEAELITPIVRGADLLPIDEIAATMKDYADRARRRRLKPDEYTGGTFTVSNLGMFGVARFASIINPPHAAILSVGGARDVLALVDGQVQARKVMAVTLTCDHRVFDGAVAARWLNGFREAIEAPDALFG